MRSSKERICEVCTPHLRFSEHVLERADGLESHRELLLSDLWYFSEGRLFQVMSLHHTHKLKTHVLRSEWIAAEFIRN
jgi:hypothetical protein